MLLLPFSQFVKQHKLFSENDTVIAAVSGGADSMCLLHLLCRMNVKVICAHVNHGLRAEAEEDQNFVCGFCRKNNIEFRFLKADVALYAKEKKISEEMAGREIRYKFFFDLKKEYGASAIATAHNKNDLSETLLLNLIRGSGSSGLAGLSPARGDGVVHPLLSTTRDEIENYLNSHAESWREDKTNAETHYVRNKIRHLIIPEILKINPSFTDAAARCSSVLSEEDSFLNELALSADAFYKKGGKIIIDAKKLSVLNIALAKRIILLALREADISPSMRAVNDIYSLINFKTGKKVPVSGEKYAWRQYESIIIEKEENIDFYSYPLPQNGDLKIPETGVTLTVSGKKIKNSIGLKSGAYTVRKRQKGDRFYPAGGRGSKKVKNFLIDLKIPQKERDHIPIIVSEDKIAAIGNIREDKEFKGTDIYIKVQTRSED